MSLETELSETRNAMLGLTAAVRDLITLLCQPKAEAQAAPAQNSEPAKTRIQLFSDECRRLGQGKAREFLAKYGAGKLTDLAPDQQDAFLHELQAAQ